jgi:hypothetical protein
VYPWDSDLFGPVDEDGNPFLIAPPAPAGGTVPPGASQIGPRDPVAPPVPDPNIAAILEEASRCSGCFRRLAAAAGGGGAAPVVDTTRLEEILQNSYERLSRNFTLMQAGVTAGYQQVAQTLVRLERTLDRNGAALRVPIASVPGHPGPFLTPAPDPEEAKEKKLPERNICIPLQPWFG